MSDKNEIICISQHSRSSPTSRYNIIILDHCAQSTPGTRSQHHARRLRAYSAIRKEYLKYNHTLPSAKGINIHPDRAPHIVDRNLVRITRHICPGERHVSECLLRTQTNDLGRKANRIATMSSDQSSTKRVLTLAPTRVSSRFLSTILSITFHAFLLNDRSYAYIQYDNKSMHNRNLGGTGIKRKMMQCSLQPCI